MADEERRMFERMRARLRRRGQYEHGEHTRGGNSLFSDSCSRELLLRRLKKQNNIVPKDTYEDLVAVVSKVAKLASGERLTMTTVIGKRTQSRICGSRYRDALKLLDESLHCALSEESTYALLNMVDRCNLSGSGGADLVLQTPWASRRDQDPESDLPDLVSERVTQPCRRRLPGLQYQSSILLLPVATSNVSLCLIS